MKKILLIVVAFIGFGISVNAQRAVAFRAEQTICADENEDGQKEKIIFFRDASR